MGRPEPFQIYQLLVGRARTGPELAGEMRLEGKHRCDELRAICKLMVDAGWLHTDGLYFMHKAGVYGVTGEQHAQG